MAKLICSAGKLAKLLHLFFLNSRSHLRDVAIKLLLTGQFTVYQSQNLPISKFWEVLKRRSTVSEAAKLWNVSSGVLGLMWIQTATPIANQMNRESRLLSLTKKETGNRKIPLEYFLNRLF